MSDKLEIEIENEDDEAPEAVAQEPENEEIELDEDTLEPVEAIEVELETEDLSFGANLADSLDPSIVDDVGEQRLETYNTLKGARENWEAHIKRGIRWLGLNTEGDGNTEVEGSCTAVHPLLMENIVKFQAKAIQELWPAKGPVRTKIKGFVDQKRESTAARVRSYMNYQLTEQIPGFYNDLERNLFRVGFMGVGIRKAGWNAMNQSPDPTIVYIENFYVDPAVPHLKDAEEYIEVMELSARKMNNLVLAGTFRDLDGDMEETLVPNEITEAITDAQGFDMSMERKGYMIGEAHCYLDFEGADPLVPDGIAAPYIVHFNIKSGHVYSIRRNWHENDPSFAKRMWYTSDHFIPAFGFYSLGYVHLIGDLTAASTAALRALVDAGQYANWQAGFKSQDAKFSNSDSPLGFGEFRDVNLSPEELQKAFLPLPTKEPSPTLFELLKYMVGSGQKFADAADEVVQNGTNYGPAATTLAMIEVSQRFYSSIHKRLHQSQHEFFRLLGELNYENLPDRVNYVVGDANEYVRRDDFNPDIVDIIPASDPNAQSESQRVARAQIELDIASRFPQLHDMEEALRRFYAAMGTDAVDKLMSSPESKAISADPLTEIQAAMSGKPIKAVLGQNHQAHIAVKTAFLQSPQMQGTNDPTVAVGKQLLTSNISEHKTLMFIAQVMQAAQQAGMPPQDESIQAAIAQQMLAQSAEQGGQGQGPSTEQQMLDINKQELQLAAARIQSQDTREAAKLALKTRELDLKETGMLLDAENKKRQTQLASAGKILDNSAKMAQIQQEKLHERVDTYK